MPPDQLHTTKPQEVRLTDETIQYLEKQISKAVQEGITAAANEEMARRFWAAGLEVLQEQAVKHTGRFVLGGLAGLIKKAAAFLVLGYLVYQFGGWTALSHFWSKIWSAA